MAKRIIGITGEYAAGKSVVTKMFAKKGAVAIDADKIAHDMMRRDARVKKKITRFFGKDILTRGAVDRRKLASEVFFDKAKLAGLARIMHPEIIKKIRKEAAKDPDGMVVIDAPLLIESGLFKSVDKVILVTAARDIRLKRAAKRGVSKREAMAIMRAQMPFSKKRKFADHIINNSGEISATKKEVEKIWKKSQK